MIHSLIRVSGISETLETFESLVTLETLSCDKLLSGDNFLVTLKTLSHNKLLSGDNFLVVLQMTSMLSSDDLIGVVSVQFSNTGSVNFKRPRWHALLTPMMGLNLLSTT